MIVKISYKFGGMCVRMEEVMESLCNHRRNSSDREMKWENAKEQQNGRGSSVATTRKKIVKCQPDTEATHTHIDTMVFVL